MASSSGQLGELLGLVAPREDAGVDGRMERLDLAADQRRDAREVADGADLDALRREVIASPVGRVDLDAEVEQAPGERGDALTVGHRQQGSHAALLPRGPRWPEYSVRAWHTRRRQRPRGAITS
jgi:hypothetical protein